MIEAVNVAAEIQYVIIFQSLLKPLTIAAPMSRRIIMLGKICVGFIVYSYSVFSVLEYNGVFREVNEKPFHCFIEL